MLKLEKIGESLNYICYLFDDDGAVKVHFSFGIHFDFTVFQSEKSVVFAHANIETW